VSDPYKAEAHFTTQGTLEKTPFSPERRRRKVKSDPRPYTPPFSILEKGS
jgi:hypothetical protein